MEIILKRRRTNRLYTEGELYINGNIQTYTLESTERLLKPGRYQVRIVLKSERKRDLCLFPCDGSSKGPVSRIDFGHSWRDAKRHNFICIGRPLIPGAMYKSYPDWMRINDRIKKCKARRKPIYLIIQDSSTTKGVPIKHWTKTTPWC